ncbi:hypothetical protein OQA88_2395 [Cercophora sp. LCS_1]
MKLTSGLLYLLATALGASGLVARPYFLRNATCGLASNLTVQTSGGTVRGTVDPSTPCVRRFLGIPYAQPPVGDLRFAPPEPTKPFGALDATRTPPSCPQTLVTRPPTIYTEIVPEYNLQGLKVPSQDVSEDCLTLSVWAPAGRNATGGGLPVIMFIYGGGFSMGGQDIPYYIPAKWVQRTQSHIMVTFNYRVGIFGFPNAAGLPFDKQNLGLLDQRLAVEWVRDNIAAFGGDPDRITLWGHSAGAVSAGFYQYAYPDDPIVEAIAMNSGSETLPAAVWSTADTEHKNFSTVAAGVGCGGLSLGEELACMRSDKATPQAVDDFIKQYNEDAFDQHFAKPIVIFTPIVDDKTAFGDYTALSKAGHIAKIPTIVGSAINDGVAFVPLSPTGVNETLASGVTLALFFCPAFKSATDRLGAGVPVYRYLYAGNFTNVAPAPFLGAYHASELPLFFGTFDDFRGPGTAFERATSAAMQDAYLALATGGVTGMEKNGWPLYASIATGQVREFGAEGLMSTGQVVNDINAQKFEAICPQFDQPY